MSSEATLTTAEDLPSGASQQVLHPAPPHQGAALNCLTCAHCPGPVLASSQQSAAGPEQMPWASPSRGAVFPGDPMPSSP